MLKNILIQVAMATLFSQVSYAQNQIMGTVQSVNGKLVTITCERTDKFPSTTDTCDVSKDISGTKNPFGITVTSGWLGVAQALFVSKKADQMTFKVVRETSEIVINGKKQEHLVKGKKLKITWK